MKNYLFPVKYLLFIMVTVTNSKKHRFSSDICNLLGIDSMKLHSFKEIGSIINTTHIKTASKQFPDLKPKCGCGQCGLNKQDLMDYIKDNLIIKDLRPTCNYYEFNQKPAHVTILANLD